MDSTFALNVAKTGPLFYSRFEMVDALAQTECRLESSPNNDKFIKLLEHRKCAYLEQLHQALTNYVLLN